MPNTCNAVQAIPPATAPAADPEEWQRFRAEYLSGDETDYQAAVRRFAESQPQTEPVAAP